MVTLELTVPLEIRRASRQDQRLAAKLAEASQAKAQREDMLREHAAEIATMIDAWDSARERLERYRTSIVPLATDRVVAARAAYRGGKATLTDLLTSHRAEIDVRPKPRGDCLELQGFQAHIDLRAVRRQQVDVRLKALQLEAIAARLWAQL